MYLKYYEDEQARWPQLWGTSNGDRGRMGEAEIETGIRRLAREFGLVLKGVRVRFTTGCRNSRAGSHTIIINKDWANWLTIAHEVAHTYQERKLRRAGFRWHNAAHAKITDRFCAWIAAQGWHLGTLAHEVAMSEVAAVEREVMAATPPPLDARIAKREAQVKRLTTKIKALESRRKSAMRSLAALKRSQAKQEDTFNRHAEAEERDYKGGN